MAASNMRTCRNRAFATMFFPLTGFEYFTNEQQERKGFQMLDDRGNTAVYLLYAYT